LDNGMRVTAREWAIRLGFLVVSTGFALGVAEVAVRTFFPIYDGRDNLTRDGKPITEWFAPGSVYRQVSNEYDALTTITDKGHRVPGVDGNPDVIFVGDSFTYGFGLSDEQTFASIYCSQRHIGCVNLGYPGSGTSRQARRLEQFLDKWGWKPKEVKLFFFGMSGSFSAGNDFVDNYNYGRWLKSKTTQGSAVAKETSSESGVAETIIGWQEPLLRHSTLLRRAKYHWGPLMRSLVVADPGQRMNEALLYTRQGLQEMDALSRRYGFTYTVYLIVPVQDIIRQSYNDTLAAVNSVSPKPVISTAPLFVKSPEQFYFAYDGHLNPTGSKRVAEFLLENDAKTPH
jgi:hypothetical protein